MATLFPPRPSTAGFPWQLILIHRTLGFRHPGLDVGCDLYFSKMQSISHRSKAAVTQKWDVECGFSVVCFSERCGLLSQWGDCCIGRVIFRMIVRAIHSVSVEIGHELVMSVAFLKTKGHRCAVAPLFSRFILSLSIVWERLIESLFNAHRKLLYVFSALWIIVAASTCSQQEVLDLYLTRGVLAGVCRFSLCLCGFSVFLPLSKRHAC